MHQVVCRVCLRFLAFLMRVCLSGLRCVRDEELNGTYKGEALNLAFIFLIAGN